MDLDNRTCPRKWFNPSIIVQSENAYSIVAKPEYAPERRPFMRYNKHKDDNGLYIFLRRNKRVYIESWKYIN